MFLLIERTYHNDRTLSNVKIFDEVQGEVIYECKALELPWRNNERQVSCIPEGMYKTKKRISAKYDEHFHLLDVPNRSWILIHHGNFPEDVLGCILVGRNHVDLDGDRLYDVSHSKVTMGHLNEYLPDVFNTVIYEKGDDWYKFVF